MTQSNYYLSDVELVAMCRCDGRNVAIFQHFLGSGTLLYTNGCILNPAEPMYLTFIQIDPHSDEIRSHFERLSIANDAPGDSVPPLQNSSSSNIFEQLPDTHLSRSASDQEHASAQRGSSGPGNKADNAASLQKSFTQKSDFFRFLWVLNLMKTVLT